MAVTKLSNSGIKTGILKYDSMLAGNAAFDPAATWLIQRTTLTTNTATVTFSSIPATYQHLQIRIMSRCTRGAANGNLILNINSDTGTNYAYHDLSGDGTSATASGSATQARMDLSRSPGTSVTADIFAGTIIDIHDYANTSKNKTVRSFFGYDNNSAVTLGNVGLRSGVWLSTNAVTTLAFTSASSSSFTAGSTFALYGFKGV